MNISSNAIFNRAEIMFYSALTSCLSGANRIRAHFNLHISLPFKPIAREETVSLEGSEILEDRISISNWVYVSQALIPLLIWMVLGFAAGFLLGMINPG